ncbi:MAG: hypothetical protein QM786_17655 [Breznakibacter sp.]
MRKLSIAALWCSCFALASAQDDNQVKIEVHGFVNHEMMYDTRQVKTAREGEVLLFPLPEAKDVDGDDKNAAGELSMFNFHTRLQVVMTGPLIGNFKSSALIEGDFLGTGDAAPNMVRMRHAFFKLANEKHEWLIGQFWHPMFVTECFPDVVSWNVALPVHVLNRAPQIRYTYAPFSTLKLSLAAVSQRDFTSYGPKSETDNTNTASSSYLKRSGVPDFQAQISFKASQNWLMGLTAGYKTLVPRLSTALNHKADESIGGYNFNVFSKLKTEKATWLVQGIYGQNLSHFLMLGGFAVKDIDAATDKRTYTNIATSSIWTDFAYQASPKIRLGIFAGYVKNNGSSDEVTAFASGKPIVFGLGNDIDYMTSISPRATYAIKRVKFMFEWNNLTAAYGTIQNDLTVSDTKNVTNNRFLFSSIYSF